MKKEHDHTYTLILTVRNSPGVLVRCAQVFNRRGHNIEALNVAAASEPAQTSHMTITAFGKPDVIYQITMQLKKLVDVINITEKEV